MENESFDGSFDKHSGDHSEKGAKSSLYVKI